MFGQLLNVNEFICDGTPNSSLGKLRTSDETVNSPEP